MSNRLPPGFNPDAIMEIPVLGQPSPHRSRRELRLAAHALGHTLEDIPDGFMATTIRNSTKEALEVRVWDHLGRLARIDSMFVVGVIDETGPHKGAVSPIFSNVYHYDDSSRVMRHQQVVTQNDFKTYVLSDRRAADY